MARVPAKVQFTRYQLIRKTWLSEQGAFGYLPVQDQWIFHCFYQPDVVHDAATLALSQAVVVERDPALPHRAGKAFKALTHIVTALEKAEKARREAPTQRTKRTGQRRVVSVRAIAQPQPDMQKLARVLIELARMEPERERPQAREDEGDDA